MYQHFIRPSVKKQSMEMCMRGVCFPLEIPQTLCEKRLLLEASYLNIPVFYDVVAITGSISLFLLGTAGEDTKSVGCVWDISNLRRLGYTELNALTELANGVKTLILLEQSLEAKEE